MLFYHLWQASSVAPWPPVWEEWSTPLFTREHSMWHGLASAMYSQDPSLPKGVLQSPVELGRCSAGRRRTGAARDWCILWQWQGASAQSWLLALWDCTLITALADSIAAVLWGLPGALSRCAALSLSAPNSLGLGLPSGTKGGIVAAKAYVASCEKEWSLPGVCFCSGMIVASHSPLSGCWAATARFTRWSDSYLAWNVFV